MSGNKKKIKKVMFGFLYKLCRYQLMLKCWSYRPEERPTFRYCLDTLQSLRNQCAEMQINIENTNRNLASSKCEYSQFDFDLCKFFMTHVSTHLHSIRPNQVAFAFLTAKKSFACYLTCYLCSILFYTEFQLVSCLFVLSGGVFNRLYLLADENHNHQEGNHLCASVTFIFHIFIVHRFILLYGKCLCRSMNLI